MAVFMLGHSTIKVPKMTYYSAVMKLVRRLCRHGADRTDHLEGHEAQIDIVVSKTADLAQNGMLSQNQTEMLLKALDANLCVLCVKHSEVVFCMECYKLIMSKLDRARFEAAMRHEESKND